MAENMLISLEKSRTEDQKPKPSLNLHMAKEPECQHLTLTCTWCLAVNNIYSSQVKYD